MATTIIKCRQCRAAGEKLFLKGDRCYTQKCAVVKRAYAPGNRGAGGGKRRRSLSEYGQQLKEKQRIKRIYGVSERQLKKYFEEASAQKGDTRENLMRRFEMRLDNVLFRLGWAKSRAAARQMAGHGHILINSKTVTIPSYQISPGEIISLKEKIKKSRLMENLAVTLKKHEAPGWLALDKEKIESKVIANPSPEDLGDLAPVSMIVEFYSR